MKNSIKQIVAVAAVALLAVSCSKNLNDVQDSQNGERLQITTDQTILKDRVHFKREPMVPEDLKSFYPVDLELVAEVASPVVNGVGLAATHIQFEGDLAYVTYHTYDGPYGGAIDVFDVSDPDNPVLLSQLTIADTDLHNLDINLNDLYVAGARDIDLSGYDASYTKGAVAQRIELDGSGLFTSNFVEVPLPSYSANSIRYHDAGVLVSTGDLGGGNFILNKVTLAILEDIGIEDAKYIHGTDSYLCVLAGDGSNSKLLVFDGGSLTATPLEISLAGKTVTPVGKNAIECYEDYILVNLGDDGLLKVNRHNGNVVDTYKYTEGDGIAISAVEFGDYTVLAYGCDGILILDNHKGTYRKIANYKYDANGSVNHVSTNGEVLFVASGLQGIKILKNTQKTCTLEHIADGAVDRSAYFELYHPTTSQHQAFAWETGTGSFVQNTDGTAQVTGTIVSLKDPNDRWDLTINLSEKMNWTQWSGLGRSYMQGADYIPGSHEDWFYYIMDPALPSTLVGAAGSANDGISSELNHKPSGLKYGFQLGMSANVKNAEYGLSGWFYYINSAGASRTGDINVNVTGC